MLTKSSRHRKNLSRFSVKLISLILLFGSEIAQAQNYYNFSSCTNGGVTKHTYSYALDPQGFETNNDGWTQNGTTTPAARYNGGLALGENYFLGRFSSGDYIQKTFALNQKSHRISFDLYRLDSWDGESFQVYVGSGTTLLFQKAFAYNQSTFNESGTSGGYNYNISTTYTGINVPYTGAPSQSTWYDQVVKVYIDVPAGVNSLTLKLSSTLNQAATDESWGIDNFAITQTQFDVPAGVTSVDVITVGGGGGGGTDGGSGGGGGGIRYGTINVGSISTLTAYPARGGYGGIWSVRGALSGDASTIYNGSTKLYEALGGQPGGGWTTTTGGAGGTGGSGGTNLQGATGGGGPGTCLTTGNQGSAGTTGPSLTVGCTAQNLAGGGGGGQGVDSPTASPFIGAAGGLGGGGQGANYRLAANGTTSITGSTAGFRGTSGTGGGGGGGSACDGGSVNLVNQRTNGGDGGSGVVIITYVAFNSSITASSNVSCVGNTDGSITVTATGGTANYNYAWSNGASTANSASASSTISGLAAGTYTVTVTDANGNTTVSSATISETAYNYGCFSSALSLSNWTQEGVLGNGTWTLASGNLGVTQGTNSNPTFFVSADTFFNTTISGQFGVMTTGDDDMIGFVLGYNSPNTNTATNNYDFILFDWKQAAQTEASLGGTVNAGARLIKYNGTSSSIGQSFWAATDPIATVLATNTSIGGWADNTMYDFTVKYTATNIKIYINGTLIFNVDGTFEPGRFGFYNYSQSNTVYQNFSIPYEAIVNSTNASCNGANDGTASVYASFGSNNEILWSTGDTTQTISNLAPGTYSVTITNNSCCADTASFTITEPTAVEATITGGTPAGLTAVPTSIVSNVNEAANYGVVYELDIPANADYTTSSITYAIDNSGAISTNHSRVAYYLQLDNEWIWVSMDDFANGNLPQLGIPRQQTNNVSWETTVGNMNVYSNKTGITTGQNITTGNIEMWHHCYTAPANSSLGGSSTIYDFDDTNNGNANCYGSFQVHNYGANQTLFGYNRFAEVGVDDLGIGNNLGSSGHKDWTYQANAGDYTTRKLYILVGNTSASFTTLSCNEDNNGQAEVSAAGGTSPYTYAWNTGGTSTIITGLSAGTYSVTITDQTGCTDSTSITINNPGFATLDLGNDTISTCGGSSVTLDAGAGFSSYTWSNTETSQSITASLSGKYIVTVTYGSGCTLTDSTTVSLIGAEFLTTDTTICIGDTAIIGYTYSTYSPATGNGADGAVTISGTQYTDNVRTAVTGTNLAGQSNITVGSVSGLNVGDEILLITMIDGASAGANAGNYQFNRIESISGTTLTLDSNLATNYTNASNVKHQVIRVPNYTNVTINSGSTLTCNAWNGSTGGVLAFKANGVVINNGTINAQGKGYRGIAHSATYRNSNGGQGEGILGYGYMGAASSGANGTWNNANGNGGGGGTGRQDAGGGAGGSYGGLGNNGIAQGGHAGGTRGNLAGNAQLTQLIMGGAGGEGGADEDGGYPGFGGNGGGIIFISADSLYNTGSINARGNNGGAGGGGSGSGMGGGGGGAGGSIFLSSRYGGTGSLIATGGALGNSNGGSGKGGAGGLGRIKVESNAIFPSSVTPAAYTSAITEYLAGDTLLLSYTWSNGDTNQTLTVSPSTSTTYVVTVSNGITSCVDTVQVNVNNPSFSLSTDTASVCGGSEFGIDAGTGWATYAWSTGATSQVDTFTLSDNYKITVTDTNGCSVEDSIVVSIVNPTTVQSDTTICINDSIEIGFAANQKTMDQIAQNANLSIAVGLRQLNSTYTGNAVLLRRSSDNATQNFAFVNGELDTNAIKTWAGLSTIYIQTIYDQSGNNKHLTNATTAQQPTLILNGKNGKPVARFTTSQTLKYASNTFNYPLTVVGAAELTTNSVGRIFGGYSNNWLFGYHGGQANRFHFNCWQYSAGVSPVAGDFYIHSSVSPTNTSHEIFSNGTALSGISACNSSAPNGLSWNGYGSGLGETSNTDIMEFVIFDDTLSIEELHLVEQSIANRFSSSLAYSTPSTTANGNFEYLWSNGDTTSTIMVQPTVTTDYIVTITDGYTSCIDSITVNVNAPAFSFSQDTLSVCGIDSILIDAGTGWTNYAWSTGNNTQTNTARSSGTYIVTVSNANGCSAEDSIVISVITTNISSADTTICVGDTITLETSLSSSNDYSLALDGNGDYALIPFDNAFNVTNLTIEAWVYSGNFNQNMFIFEKGPLNTQYSLFFEGANLVFRTYHSGGSGTTNWYINSASIGFTATNWHHVAATYDGSTKKIYVDGSLAASTACSGALATNTSGAIIGAYGGSGGHNYYFNGNIDEVRVWSVARTASEIASSYSSMVSPATSGLVGYWNFEEGSGSTTENLVDNQNAVFYGNSSFSSNTTSISNSTNLNYLWSNGDTTSTIQVSPASNTTYTLTISDGISSCTDSVMVSTTSSTFNFAQDTISACGDDSILVDAGIGFANYTWSNGNNTQTSSITISGTYYVTVGNGIGCDATDSIVVSVVNSSIISNDTTLCVGDSIELIAKEAGTSLMLNGTNDYIQIPTNLHGGNQSTITIEAWVKTADGTTLSGEYPNIVCSTVGGNNASTNVQNLQFRVYQDKLQFLMNTQSTGWNGVSSTTSVNDNQWHHVAVVKDGSTSTKLYLDGVLEATGNVPNTLTADEFLIGAYRQDNALISSGFMNGSIDEVRIWNTARTASEISLNMNKTINSATGLVGSFSFNEESGNTTKNATTSTSYSVNGAAFETQPNQIQNYQYDWSTGSTATSVQFSPTANTTIYVTITDGISFCIDSVTINANNPTFNFAQDSIVACSVDSVLIDAGTGWANYTWSNGNTMQSFYADASGTYNLTVSDANGCSAQDSLVVSAINANLTVPDTTICIGASLELASTAFNLGYTARHPFTNPNQIYNVPSGVYWYATSTDTFQIQVDSDVDGGGWILALNYVHLGGTNPALNILSNKTPLLNSETLGNDESSNSSSWGHINNALFNALNPEEVRFYGITSGHSRVMHFKSNSSSMLSYFGSGTGAISGLNNSANYTLLNGHTALLPSTANTYYSNEGDMSMTNFPFYLHGTYHWGIRGLGTRWEVDDYPNNFSNSTVHQIWVRAGVSAPAVPTEHYSFTWSTGDTTEFINVSPTSNTTYTVTVSNGISSCVDTVSVSLYSTQPTASVHDTVVYLNTNGLASLSAAMINNGSTDACGVDSIWISDTLINCASAGDTIAVKLYIRNVTNSVDSAIANVIVLDTFAPSATSQNITVYLDASGNISIVPADVNNGSTDNCAIASYSLDNSSFTCADLGANNVILTVADSSGNSSNANATVTVLDTISPTVIAQNISVYLDASGNTSIAAADVNNGSTDNCSIASLLLSSSAFTCANIGANTVTLTATDGSGNTNTATAVVTVLDTFAPSVNTQNITVYLDASGNTSIVAADINNGSTDNCGIASYSLNISSFACSDLGTNNVVLTATDSSGNSSTASATVTVIDTISPVSSAQNITVYLDASGNASIAASDVNNGSTDNCAIASMSVLPSTFTCANLGGNTATLTVTDSSGNTATSAATVTVIDTISPIASAQNIMVYLDASGNTSIAAADVNNGSTDNCAIASLSVSASAFTCANIGANTVTLTATDGSGNTNTATAVVTVLDTFAPSVITQILTVYLDGSGNTSISATDVNNGSTDNCAIASMSVYPNTFTCSELNANTVTLTVTDVSGNTATATATVTVLDTIAPSVVTQNITVYLDANGNANITATDIDNGSSDNCSINTMTATPSAFSCADSNTNTVTLTVTDASGNTNSATATVIVLDTFAPSVITQNITVNLDANGNASIAAADVNNGSSDNCAIATMSVSPNTFTCVDSNANMVTLTVTDVSGNVSSATATVTVVDNIAPTVLTQNITVYLDANGTVNIGAADVNNGSSDNCAIASMSVAPNTFTCADSNTNTVTLSVTDVSGNVNAATATVTVLDTISPVAVAQNITVYLDSNGTASITGADLNNASTDNCAIASYDVAPSAFTCADSNANTVTLSVTDVSGNSSTTLATVIVLDTISPIAMAQNITVYLDANGAASIVAADVDNGSTDNCAIASMSVVPNTFTCVDSNANTVTLTVTDVSGNVNTTTATVTVLDTFAPSVATQNITVYLDGNGNTSISAADVNNGSTDNCAIASMSVFPNAFTCANLGVNTATLTVIDSSGNTATSTATVTVLDTISPVATAQNITVYLDATGNTSITAEDVNNGSTDNCSIASLSVSTSAFTCANIGANTVTLTATDGSGNVNTGTATVTVLDTFAPSVITQNITIYLDASGNTSIAAADVNNGSTDNCAIASMSVAPNAFTCAELNSNTVTLTVNDVNGNTATSTATVTVLDTISPVAAAQNITVYLDVNGAASIVPADVDNNSNDNCAIASYSVNPNTFICADSNANTVTLTVTDVSGNSSSTNATVTVLDTFAPSVVTQNITVNLDANGNASIVATDVNNGSTDNCAIASMSVSPNTFTCADSNTNTVTLLVTDVSGNTATNTATVNIVDNIAPTVATQNITVYLTGFGTASIVPADVDNGSTDNCAIASYHVWPNSFTCADTGSNTVTLTVTDVSGNVNSAVANVIVLDTLVPNVVAQNASIYLDVNGQVSITPATVDGGSSNSCGAGVFSVTPNTFTCADSGDHLVTLTLTSTSGVSNSATAIVTVIDTLAPSVLTQNITVYLDANGNANIVAADVNNGSFDNCAIASMSVSPNTFTCADSNANTVTLTVTDVSGNVNTATAIVTVLDTFAPSVATQNITVYLDANGAANIVPADVDNGSFDNCAIASYSVVPNTFVCTDSNANTVTLYATDVSGNVNSEIATVTVLDTLAPTVLTQNITVYLDANGTASIVPADVDNNSSDNCTIASMSVSPNTFTCGDSNANTVTLTVTDVSGNVNSATATVNVLDTNAPIVMTQNITVYLDANGAASIVPADINNNSTDNCAIASYSVAPNTFMCADSNANTVTLSVTDVSGNVNTAPALVTVLDTISPSAIAQNITIYLDITGAASIVPADVDNGSSDNCAIASMSVSPNTFTCADSNANSVTLTVTDVSGNASSTNAIITVLDTFAPSVITQNISVYLDVNGAASIVAADVDNNSTDNCAIASMSVSPNTFTCTDSNSNTVTLTATDVSGNVNSTTATVTVLDTIAPSVVTQNITVYLAGSGTIGIVPADVNNGSTDNCAIANYSVSPDNFSCADTGSNTVTLTITDVSGNVNSATATVMVLDTLVPSVVAQNATVYLDANGQVSITTATVDGGSANSCSVGSFTVTPNTFTCADSGDNVVTLTMVSGSGVSNSATAIVTVLDTLAPIVITNNPTVYLDASGNASIVVADVNNGSTDNCAIASMSVAPNTFTCADSNANTVTLTVTDVSGNVNTATATVMVLDTIAPSVATQNITVYLDANGAASIVPADVDNGSSDNCAIAIYDVQPNSFNCNDTAANMVTLTLTDVSGNVNAATAIVTVLDTIAPTVIGQNITSYLGVNGTSSITVSDVNNGSFDNCGIANITAYPTSFSQVDTGDNVITIVATDQNGNMDSTTIIVTVIDTIAPTAIAQNITLYLDASGNAAITANQLDNGSFDNCGVDTITLSQYTFSCADSNANTVAFTVTDINGNATTVNTTVWVFDTIAPSIFTQNINVYLDANGAASIVPADVDNGSSDNCAIATYDVQPNSFNCNDTAANMVTLTLVDVSGNTSSATAIVTVLDTIAPTVIGQNITSYLGVNGTSSITVSDVNNGSFDNCGIANITAYPTSFSQVDTGDNVITIVATDQNGNMDSTTIIVTVIDTIAPTAIAQNITLYLDASGNAAITANQLDNGSFDNCGVDTITLSQYTFSCADSNANTVAFTVTDINGNATTVNTTVSVFDTIAPSIFTQNINVYLDANGAASIVPADVDNGSSDNCAIATYDVQPNSFNCNDTAANMVTLTLVDVSGNTSSATAIVTVLDTIAPTVIGQNITSYLGVNGTSSITVSDVNNGSFDNCGIANITAYPTSFSQVDTGDNVITIVATDQNGNMDSTTVIVTVVDTIVPTAIAQNVTVYLDSTGNIGITANQLNNGSFDNCGVDTITLSNYSFNCADTGENVVAFTVTDINGNSTTINTLVWVYDTIAPSIALNNPTIYLDENGSASISVTMIDAGCTDNCAIDTSYLSQYDFDCSMVGLNTVTITVIDIYENVSSAVVEVTVTDTIRPTVLAQNITLYLDENGAAATTASAINTSSFDNCGIDSIYLSDSSFVYTDGDSVVIQLYIVDVNGNVNNVSATVTLIDTIAPSIVCPANISTCDINIDYNLPEVADNTEVSSLVLTAGLNPGDEFEVGFTTITYVVTDLSGNQNTCSFDIERYALPTVTAMADTAVYYAENLDMIISDSLAVSYRWTPSEFLNDANIKQPVCSPTENTLYTVEVTTENGCTASDDVYVTILNEIRFAQAFSPNGDGENDYFEIQGIELYPDCKVTIVNRYGSKLFTSEGYSQPWDGTRKGQVLPMGSYFYIIELGANHKPVTGSISIIR